MFDQIGNENARVSIFKRLERKPSPIAEIKGKASVFQRLGEDHSSSTRIDKNGQAP